MPAGVVEQRLLLCRINHPEQVARLLQVIVSHALIPVRGGAGDLDVVAGDAFDPLDDAVERGERPVGDAHLLADLENDRRLRPLDPLLDLAHDPRGLALADRRRPAAPAEKAGDLGGVLDEMPGLIVKVHLDQHISGEEFALRADFGAALDFDDLFGRHQDLVEALAEPLLLGLLADRRRDLLLEAGINVDHVPVARHP